MLQQKKTTDTAVVATIKKLVAGLCEGTGWVVVAPRSLAAHCALRPVRLLLPAATAVYVCRAAMLLRDVGCVLVMGYVLAVSRVAYPYEIKAFPYIHEDDIGAGDREKNADRANRVGSPICFFCSTASPTEKNVFRFPTLIAAHRTQQRSTGRCVHRS